MKDQVEPAEELVAAYQRLVEKEYEKYKELKKSGSGYSFNDQKTFLTEDDISSAGINRDVFNEMLRRGLIISFGRNLYRTTHFDLIYRLTQIRYFEDSPPLPLEFNIVMKKELVPDFREYKMDEILPKIVESQHKDLIIKSLGDSLRNKGYEGLSSYQFKIVKEILSGHYKNVAIVAPTASGKTLTFLMPVLIKSIERAAQNKAGLAGLLIYPRRALERDQLQSLIQLVDAINIKLQSNGKSAITIGIDDGDTPRESQVKDGDSFRKLRCINCGGELIIKQQKGEFLVICKNCQKEYHYIIPTKDRIWEKKPTILITNIWTVYRRLLSPRGIKMFDDIDFIVIDEAHVYSHFLGGHVSYILKMLRFVSSQHGHSPVFVFSSATIPNPKEFISNLGRISESELYYEDFQETLKSSPGRKLNRILLYLYILPHPNWDIETLAEALIPAITLWCHKYKMKSITFIDSISEINTMMDYIHTTILGIRKGREILDHIFTKERSPNNDYCWVTLVPDNYNSSSEPKLENFLLNDYKQSIEMHYGGLSLEKRAKIEREFSEGRKRMLLSTSTLELGIDLSDVAVILQYKLPITPEGVVQRVGRAGRDPKCYRIALGVVVLPTLPLSTLYMFDERLRKTLEEVSFLPPLRVGMASHNIKLQHTLSLLLLKRALERKRTYIDIEEGIKANEDVITCLEEIKEELKHLPSFNKNINLIKEEDLKGFIEMLEKEINDLLEGYDKRGEKIQGETYDEKISNIREDLEKGLELAKDIKKMADELKNAISSSGTPPPDVIKWLDNLITLSNFISSIIYDIRNRIRIALESRDSYLLDEWFRENHNAYIEAVNQLPNPDEPSKYFDQLRRYFRDKKKISFNEIMAKWFSLGMSLEKKDVLSKIPSELNFIKSIDLKTPYTEKALRRVRKKIEIVQSKLDLFQVLNLLLEGKVHFSLLLETPSPDLELVGVEEI